MLPADEVEVEIVRMRVRDDDLGRYLGSVGQAHSAGGLVANEDLVNAFSQFELHAVFFTHALVGLRNPDHAAAGVPYALML